MDTVEVISVPALALLSAGGRGIVPEARGRAAMAGDPPAAPSIIAQL